jgi:hypothetical protein
MAGLRRPALGDVRPAASHRIQIHWDRIPTSGDRAAADAQALADQINAAGGRTAPPPPVLAFGAPAQPLQDSLDRVARLAQLHKDGALTDAGFASLKAKILEQPA